MASRSPHKILYLITKSNFGGAQKYVFELAAAAHNAGMNVVVAHGGTGQKDASTGLLKAKLDETGIRTTTIQAFMRDMSILRDLKAFIEVYRLLRRERPTVLHVSSSKAGGIGATAGRLARVPRIVFTSHGLTMDETWRPRWQRTLIAMFTWLTMRLAHHSIMITTETYERVRAMPGLTTRVSLIFNGIAPVSFISREEARRFLAPTLPNTARWVGGIGELHKNKNWSAVIRALALVPSSTHLIIIGTGEEQTTLTRLADQLGVSTRVHIISVPEHAARYLHAFDVFLLPSKKEGLPYVLLEAGLASLPVIASDLPGNHDIIDSGSSGMLLNPTPENLATAITTLTNDQERARAYGTALHETVTDTFSLTTMITRTFACYDSQASLTAGAR